MSEIKAGRTLETLLTYTSQGDAYLLEVRVTEDGEIDEYPTLCTGGDNRMVIMPLGSSVLGRMIELRDLLNYAIDDLLKIVDVQMGEKDHCDECGGILPVLIHSSETVLCDKCSWIAFQNEQAALELPTPPPHIQEKIDNGQQVSPEDFFYE